MILKKRRPSVDEAFKKSLMETKRGTGTEDMQSVDEASRNFGRRSRQPNG